MTGANVPKDHGGYSPDQIALREAYVSGWNDAMEALKAFEDQKNQREQNQSQAIFSGESS